MSKAIVYSGPACSWCERVKVLLQENDYEIEEKSIVNKRKVEEIQNKFNQTKRTVPQEKKDGESFEQMYKRFKRGVKREGTLQELRQREYFVKNSEEKKNFEVSILDCNAENLSPETATIKLN